MPCPPARLLQHRHGKADRHDLAWRSGSGGPGGLARRQPRGFWSWVRLGNVRDNDPGSPFCRRGLLTGTNGSAVDHLDVTIMRGCDGIHHPVPDSGIPPSHEAVVAGGARTVALGKIAPRRARSQHPKHPVQYEPIIDARDASRFVLQ